MNFITGKIKGKNSLNQIGKDYFNNEKKNEDNEIINQLLLNNPDILKDFKKKQSKTPNKKINPLISIANSDNFRRKNNEREYIGNSRKNSKNKFLTGNQKNINKHNLRKIHSTPLIRYITIKEDMIKKERDRIYLSQKLNSAKTLKREISFSILKPRANANKIKEGINQLNDNKRDKFICDIENNANLNLNIENNINNNNFNINKVVKHSSKVVKKIYKIESMCQVGYNGPGVLKYNQDNFFIYKNLNDENNVLYIGVCDGHGVVGHEVSKYLINHLPSNLNKALKKTNKYIHDKKTLYKTIKEVFINTNRDLCRNQFIDTQFSGSTCVSLILKKNKIISANAGDSRAVLGRYNNGEWISIDLSHDQKPNNPGERERILSHGGRIEAFKDEYGNDFGPKRVWIKKGEIPGLAMSRSFGDEVAASVGTISEPEIETFDMTKDDKFIIIASDGIWEYISSQECVNIVKDYYLRKDLKGCLKFLLNESSKRWIKEEEVIDDITAVLIFFED